jgi:hypothetical protein
MAIGDIKSCSIESTGWYALITVDSLSTGGTYSFGMGTNNDPSVAKIVLNVTSEGYTNGVLGTRSRTIYGVPCTVPDTGAMRKAYPNATAADETVSGSDVVIKVALSQRIFNDDTDITISVAAGWYTQGGTPSNICTSLSVTNNSTLDYPKVVGNWGIENAKVVTGNFDVEFLAFHGYAQSGKQVDCVKITATDQHTNSVTYTVSSMSKSTRLDYKTVIAYIQTINVSTLTDDDLITIQAQAYPWIGDADSILNTNDGVNTWPTPLYTNLIYRLDKANDHGHTCVSATGNDGTGAVYGSQTLAEAGNHFLTIAAALTALAAYHNTNSGHNDAGGGTIYLDANTWTLNSTNGGTLSQWVTITQQSTATQSTAIIQADGTLAGMPTRMRLYDLTLSGSGYFSGTTSTKSLWIDKCIINTTGAVTIYSTVCSYCTYSSGTIAQGFLPYSTMNSPWVFVRGNNFSTRVRCVSYVTVGNHNVYNEDRVATNTSPLNNNGIYAFNYNTPTDTTTQFQLATVNNIDGFACIQNVLERHGVTTEPIMWISGDATTTTTNNIILQHNTLAGARTNNAYNDIASGGPYAQTNWYSKNNCWDNWNNKDDTFGSNADAIGGWSVGYHVDSSGEFYRTTSTDEWLGEFKGLYSKWGTVAVPLSPAFVDDQSTSGGNAGNGDYHLSEASPCIGLAHDLILLYDLEGEPRYANGAIGAYELSGSSDLEKAFIIGDCLLESLNPAEFYSTEAIKYDFIFRR